MTFGSEMPGELREAVNETRAKWGWFVVLGILLLIFGIVALYNLVAATVASVYLIGILMLIGGIVEIIHSFTVRTWGSFFVWLLSGILYGIAGILALYNPLLASVALTLLLALALIVSGLLRLWVGFTDRSASGWGWIVATGIVSIIVGLIIASHWPWNSLWVLGLVLVIDLLFQGWTFLIFGFTLRSAQHLKPTPAPPSQ